MATSNQTKGKKPSNSHISLAKLNRIIETQARLASANFDLNAFMNLVVSQMKDLTPATGVVVELVENDEMVYRAAVGSIESFLGLRLKIGTSISGLCVNSKEVLNSTDTEKDPRVNIEACRKVGARSLVVTPLFHEGNAVGVLKIVSTDPNAFNDSDVKTLQIMAGLIASGLAHQMLYETNKNLLLERTKVLRELKNAQRKLQHLAEHDYLTDMPNRSLFMNRLNAAIAKSQRSKILNALLFMDVDHFKKINDTYGHAIGDDLLKAFSQRVQQCTRESDIVARIGGDEFVLLLDGISHKEDAVAIAQKIIEKMKKTFQFQDVQIQITTSVGITYFNDARESADELLSQADQALYSAKTSGRNNFQIYSKTS